MSVDSCGEVTKEMLFIAAKSILRTLEWQGEELREIKERLGHINDHGGGLVMQFSRLEQRLSLLDGRLEGIETRLGRGRN